MSVFQEDNDLAISFRNLRKIESVKSAVQKIELFQHPLLGKILTINGELQHVENWQALYHEPLIHIPTAFVTELREVLILGGGSLFAAAEVFRYDTVRRCTLVDHDPAVLDLMARHYPHAKKIMKEPRFTYIEQNATDFLSRARNKYDLLVNDCFDSVRVSEDLGSSVFRLMTSRLTSQGVCADPIYRHVFESYHGVRTRVALEKMNSYALSLITVPEYPGTLHLLACWGNKHISQDLRLPRNFVQKSWLTQQKRATLKFYDPKFLPFHLYLPPYLKQVWSGSLYKRASKTEFLRRTV